MTSLPRPSAPKRTLKVRRFLTLVAAAVVAAAAVGVVHHYQLRAQAGAVLARATLAAAEQNADAAARQYKEYLLLKPKTAAGLAEFAEALEPLADARPATANQLVEVYERIRTLDTLDDAQRRRLAKRYVQIQQYAAARDNITDLLSAGDPANPDAELLELSATCDEREQLTRPAIETLRQAVATGRASPEAYARLATLLRQGTASAEAEREAEDTLARLVKERPAEVKVRVLRSQFYAKYGTPKQARAEVEFAYRSLPGGADSPDVLLTLAAAATADRDLPLAREVLQKGVAADPKNSRLQLALAEMQIQAGELAAARDTLAKAAAAQPKLDLKLLEIGDRLADLGDTAAVAPVAARFGADPATHYVRDYLQGRVLLAEGNWPAAAPLLTQSLESGLRVVPTYHGKALVGLADCASLANRPDEQADYLADAARADPQSVPARLGQAEGYARAGHVDKAVELYAGLAGSVPSARLALIDLRISQILAKPEAERDWSALDPLFGPPPLPPELLGARANALVLQNKPADAAALLQAALARPDVAPLPGPRVALALAQAGQSLPKALDTLKAAEAAIGDRVEFRLARAALALRDPGFKPEALAAHADKAEAFTAAQRFQLRTKLAALLRSAGRPAEALALLKPAAADNPHDLALRVEMLELAGPGDAPLRQQLLADLDRLEGPGGPVRAVVEALAELSELKPGDAAKLPELRRRVEAARDQRPAWGAARAALGAVLLAEGRGDAALAELRAAYKLGERSDAVVRNLVTLLIARQQSREARDLLATLGRSAGLPPDLAQQLTFLEATDSPDAKASLDWARRPAVAASKDWRDHLVRARVFEANRLADESKRAIQQAVDLDRTRPESWLLLVRVLLAANQREAAAQAAREAEASLKPTAGDASSEATVALTLGGVKELLGDKAAAGALYQKAHALLPLDPPIVEQLHRFYRQTGRAREANALYEPLLEAKAPLETRLWARRNLAFDRVAEPPGADDLARALELIDANLKEGGDLIDDVRARALVLSTDPFRQPEAIQQLQKSAEKGPLTADQHYQLGRMHLQQGAPDKAEAAFTAAAKAGGPPEALAALVRLQVERGNVAGARDTLARLKAAAPASFEARAEEARVLVAAGRAADGVAVLTSEAGLPRDRVAAALEDLKQFAAARKAYDQFAAADGPAAHAPLAAFLLRQGQAAEALDLAWGRRAKAPPSLTAQLLGGVARVRPTGLVPEPEREAWAGRLREAADWVRQRREGEPKAREFWHAQAELADALGQYDEELALYEQALALDSRDPAFLNNAAMLLALTKPEAAGRALALIDKLIAARGPRPSWLDTRALVHLQAGSPADAARDLTAAIGLSPRAVFYYHLALAHDRQGRPDSARARDAAMAEAERRGLTPGALHAKEWPEYERLRRRGE